MLSDDAATGSDVARTAPVGLPLDPYVPVCAYIFATIFPVGPPTFFRYHFAKSKLHVTELVNDCAHVVPFPAAYKFISVSALASE